LKTKVSLACNYCTKFIFFKVQLQHVYVIVNNYIALAVYQSALNCCT